MNVKLFLFLHKGLGLGSAGIGYCCLLHWNADLWVTCQTGADEGTLLSWVFYNVYTIFIQPLCEFDMFYAILSPVTGTISCPVLRMAPWDCGVSKHSRVWWDIKDTIIQFGIHSSLLMVITLCLGDMTEWLGKKPHVFFTCLGQFVVDQAWNSLADILLPTLLLKINFMSVKILNKC